MQATHRWDAEKVPAADIPARLRTLAPDWAPYRTITGLEIRRYLETEHGVKVATTGHKYPSTRPRSARPSPAARQPATPPATRLVIRLVARGTVMTRPVHAPWPAGVSEVVPTVAPAPLRAEMAVAAGGWVHFTSDFISAAQSHKAGPMRSDEESHFAGPTSLAHAPAQKPWTCRDRGWRWRVARPAATTGGGITAGPNRARVTTPPAPAKRPAPPHGPGRRRHRRATPDRTTARPALGKSCRRRARPTATGDRQHRRRQARGRPGSHTVGDARSSARERDHRSRTDQLHRDGARLDLLAIAETRSRGPSHSDRPWPVDHQRRSNRTLDKRLVRADVRGPLRSPARRRASGTSARTNRGRTLPNQHPWPPAISRDMCDASLTWHPRWTEAQRARPRRVAPVHPLPRTRTRHQSRRDTTHPTVTPHRHPAAARQSTTL